jgi:hypothetical protein
VLAREHNNTLYVIAVSSQERPVTARIAGLPDGIGALTVHCEDRGEDKASIPVTEGAVEDVFPWLTVHLYTAAMPAGN